MSALARRDIDRWAVVYLAVSGSYYLVTDAPSVQAWSRLGLHLTLALAIWYLPPWLRTRRGAVPRLLGEIYLPLLFPLLYSELRQLGLTYFGADGSLDPWFIRLEDRLFGAQPSLIWSEAWPWPWLHELLEFAYFTYYVIAFVVLVMILHLPQGRWPALRALVRDLSATMLLCYALYTFFPVWGPKYFQAGPVAVAGGPFTRVMEWIHAHGAVHGAAFPSSHVAGTLVPWYHAWKNVPRSRPWMTAQLVLLSAATVYCRYHYVVDVIAGFLLGALVLWACERNPESSEEPMPEPAI